MAFKRIAASLLVLASVASIAQEQSFSPYSIYGLGDEPIAGTTAHAGMAGTQIGLYKPAVINAVNPASFSQIFAPTFELGIASNFLALDNGTSAQSGNDTYIKNIQFAFPLINKTGRHRRLGLSFGLVPFTRTGYTVSVTDSLPEVGEVEYLFRGDGGLNKLYLGLGYDLVNDSGGTNILSIGATGNYLFGHINKHSYTVFDPSGSFYNNQSIKGLSVSDIMFSGGIFYQHRWYTDPENKEKVKAFSIGATFTPKTSAQTFFNEGTFTYRGDSAARVYYDTLVNEEVRGSIDLPMEYGIGAGFYLNNKWTFLADYSFGQMSALAFNGSNQQLNDVQRASVGVEWIPDHTAFKRFFQVMRYRAGARYSLSRLSINGNQLAEYGINFGLGVPILASKSGSMLNVAFEYGQRQTPSVTVKETYYRLSFGITVTPHQFDRWFHKRKYD